MRVKSRVRLKVGVRWGFREGLYAFGCWDKARGLRRCVAYDWMVSLASCRDMLVWASRQRQYFGSGWGSVGEGESENKVRVRARRAGGEFMARRVGAKKCDPDFQLSNGNPRPHLNPSLT